jgi:hypothetical protein
LGYYNQCNYFSIFKPTGAANILKAIFIWTKLGWSILPKFATEFGQVVRRTKINAKNGAKYKIQSNIYLGFKFVVVTTPFRSNQAK